MEAPPEQEVWKPIPCTRDKYWASTFGRIWSCCSNYELIPRAHLGYLRTTITMEEEGKAKSKAVLVHKLVMKTFVPPIEGKPYINHIDSNKCNNRLTNLEYCDASRNSKHSRDYREARGIKTDDRKAILIESKDGEKKIIPSVNEAAEFFNICPRYLRRRLVEGNVKGYKISHLDKEIIPRPEGGRFVYYDETTGITNEYRNYVITRDGRIYSLKTQNYMKLGVESDGYACVKLQNGTKRIKFLVHRIVAAVFIVNPDPKNKTQVNHKYPVEKPNKLDNRVENLEWVSGSENINLAVKNRSTRRKVLQIDNLTYAIIAKYDSIADAARAVKIRDSGISAVLAGRSLTAASFQWRYANEFEEETKEE